ncbi:unnamed protein product (mitochondrion) [Plasmodiophora brassicae]|uniref:RRM domain-containing protein n=1 Tax=Plasmodiophora brassicae TaxID=37360 RepID=A0A0G4J846_PLABS|nr:hypothetical protein PBRA_003337 [Plasmodiophora brassicae]SPQ99689.1 unnamed protein product [Plasmodiophora brassicae]
MAVADAIDDVMDESSESHDDDDDEEEDEESAAIARVAELKSQLSFNPSYETFDAYIQALRSAMQFDELGAVRQEMASRFPLEPRLWLEWIEDEQRVGADTGTVVDLFERALSDFVSVDLWVRYATFMGADARPIFERAVDSCGTHFVEGARLWAAFREFESDRPERVQKLFARQLGIPLQGLPDLFHEYEAWSNTALGQPPRPVPSHEKALTVLKQLLPFEKAVAERGDEASWDDYIAAQVGEKSPHLARCTMLFERALTVHFASESLWERYVIFSRVHSRPDLLRVCRRAVRNCPWSATLWSQFIASSSVNDDDGLSASNAILDEAVSVLSSTSSDGVVRVLLEMCYAVRRASDPVDGATLRSLFERALTYDQYSDGRTLTEPAFRLYSFWAEMDVALFDDRKTARDHWDVILRRDGRSCAVWTQYVEFERRAGDIERVRTAFKRATHALQNTGPDSLDPICRLWLQIEAESGTVASLDDATLRCQAILRRRDRAEQRRAAAAAAMAPQQSSSTAAKRRSEPAVAEDKTRPAKRVRFESESSPDGQQQQAGVRASPGCSAFVQNVARETDEGRLTSAFAAYGNVASVRIPVDARGRRRGFAYVTLESPEQVQSAIGGLDQTELDGRIITVQKAGVSGAIARRHEADAGATLFVKGFSRDLSQADVEVALKSQFGKHGVVRQVRIPPGARGKLKGFAYVEFASSDAARAALAENAFQLGGLPVSVAMSNPPRKNEDDRGAPPVPTFSQSKRHVRLDVAAEDGTSPDGAPARATAPKSNADFRKLALGRAT